MARVWVSVPLCVLLRLAVMLMPRWASVWLLTQAKPGGRRDAESAAVRLHRWQEQIMFVDGSEARGLG